MGQRLNLEIVDNKGTLANSYYHWSAYTGSAIELTESVLSAFYDLPDDMSRLELAVSMLQETGAGVYSEEWERIGNDSSNKYSGIHFQNARDRNCGLLSVTEQGIEETERWEEYRVTVNIESKIVDFQVVYESDPEEYNDDMDDEDAFDNLTECDIAFENVPFHEFYTVRGVFEDYPDGFRTQSGHAVTWIG